MRPRVNDIGFMVLATLGVIGVALGRPDEAGAHHAFDVVVVSIGVVVLWWRRAAPLLVTWIGLAILLITGNPATAMIGLFTLAIRQRDRVLVITAVNTAVVAILRSKIDQGWATW